MRAVNADEVLESKIRAEIAALSGELVPACAVEEAKTLTLNTMRDEIYADAVAHGLWDYPQYCRTSPEMISRVRWACLDRIYEELTEASVAIEEPEHFAEELADTVITIFSVAGHLGIDIDAEIKRKMEINKGRSWKHGKV